MPAVPPIAASGAAPLEERVQALVSHYRRVQHERMQGIPLLNAALQVEAVGFEWGAAGGTAGVEDCEAGENDAAGKGAHPQHPAAEGVLITPWFMNLVRLPALWQPHQDRVGRRFVRSLGVEQFDFIGAFDAELGYHECCALFSPMNGFSDQALARATAHEALALVRRPAGVMVDAGLAAAAPAACVSPAAPAAPATEAEVPLPGRRALFGLRTSSSPGARP